MNPLNVGILEILVILALALVLFGPSKLISLVTSLRGAVQEFQRAAQGLASAAVEESKAETTVPTDQPVGFHSEDREEDITPSPKDDPPPNRTGPHQL